LLSRLEDRSQLRLIAEAGAKKAIAALRTDLERNDQNYSSYGKYYRHNNPDMFYRVALGEGYTIVSYQYLEEASAPPKVYYGFIDEESKLNMNTASRDELKRLMDHVVTTDSDEAQGLVEAIISWREKGETQLTGFYSDDYYASLQYPYEAKHFFFESLDELSLVKGLTPNVLKKLSPLITIYGDGRVNINTASKEVLRALGLEDVLVDKILMVRQGLDGLEHTVDDHIFYKTFDVASEITNFIELSVGEVKQIDDLNTLGKIKTNSSVFLIQAQGYLEGTAEELGVVCVYNSLENYIEYWREK